MSECIWYQHLEPWDQFNKFTLQLFQQKFSILYFFVQLMLCYNFIKSQTWIFYILSGRGGWVV